MIQKDLVQHRFEKAFASYGEHACLQQTISHTLFAQWQSHAPHVASILELAAAQVILAAYSPVCLTYKPCI